MVGVSLVELDWRDDVIRETENQLSVFHLAQGGDKITFGRGGGAILAHQCV